MVEIYITYSSGSMTGPFYLLDLTGVFLNINESSNNLHSIWYNVCQILGKELYYDSQ